MQRLGHQGCARWLGLFLTFNYQVLDCGSHDETGWEQTVALHFRKHFTPWCHGKQSLDLVPCSVSFPLDFSSTASQYWHIGSSQNRGHGWCPLGFPSNRPKRIPKTRHTQMGTPTLRNPPLSRANFVGFRSSLHWRLTCSGSGGVSCDQAAPCSLTRTSTGNGTKGHPLPAQMENLTAGLCSRKHVTRVFLRFHA